MKVQETAVVKNELERVGYSFKAQLDEEEERGAEGKKLTPEEASNARRTLDDLLEWLDTTNREASLSELKEKQQQFQLAVQPLCSKLQSPSPVDPVAPGNPVPGSGVGGGGTSNHGPQVEEID